MNSECCNRDYSLFDAFKFLGVRLYGSEWTGNEVERERAGDPRPVLEARAPLAEEVERVCTQLSEKYREQKEVEGRADVQRVNNEIYNLKRRQNDLYHQLHELSTQLQAPASLGKEYRQSELIGLGVPSLTSRGWAFKSEKLLVICTGSM